MPTCMTAVRKDCGEKSPPSHVHLGSPSSPVQMSSCLLSHEAAAAAAVEVVGKKDVRA